jgi:hypothetical protein
MTTGAQPISQASTLPTAKVAAGGAAGAATVVLVYILGLFHLAVTPELGSAVTVIFSFAASYLIKGQTVTVTQSTDAPAS